MEFVLSEEQQILKASVGRLASDISGLTAPERLRSMAEFGLLTLGLDAAEPMALECVLVAEALGEARVPSAFAAAQMGAAPLLAQAGRDALIGEIAGGKALVVPALHEPGRRYALKPAATILSRGKLSGEKAVVMAGMEATHLLVSAREKGQTVVVLLPAGADGVTRRAFTGLDGREGAELTLSNVTGADVLLRGDAAEAALEALVERVSVGLVADALGAMNALMAMTAEYLQTRRQFGRPIGAFQALQHRFVDMQIAHELARSMAIGAARALEVLDGVARSEVIAVARLQAIRSGRKIGEEAIQMHGAMGMTAEYPAGDHLKRLIVDAALYGDADHQLGRLVALRHGSNARAAHAA